MFSRRRKRKASYKLHANVKKDEKLILANFMLFFIKDRPLFAMKTDKENVYIFLKKFFCVRYNILMSSSYCKKIIVSIQQNVSPTESLGKPYSPPSSNTAKFHVVICVGEGFVVLLEILAYDFFSFFPVYHCALLFFSSFSCFFFFSLYFCFHIFLTAC